VEYQNGITEGFSGLSSKDIQCSLRRPLKNVIHISNNFLLSNKRILSEKMQRFIEDIYKT
jgi:hypothetical protein